MPDRSKSKRLRAVEVLKTVLTQVSGVKLKAIDVGAQQLESVIDIVAQIEVYGHAHTLACMLVPSDDPQQARESVLEFCDHALNGTCSAIPVLIAPRLSSNLQRLSRETKASVLDLKGNARIELGEIFIACQQVGRPEMHRKGPRSHTLKDSAHAGVAA